MPFSYFLRWQRWCVLLYTTIVKGVIIICLNLQLVNLTVDKCLSVLYGSAPKSVPTLFLSDQMEEKRTAARSCIYAALSGICTV
jgi:hypothetical protein